SSSKATEAVGVALQKEGSYSEHTAAGIPETLVRYSAGIEDADDLIADLKQDLLATQKEMALV
ncbi:MAG: PLP-dependent transferase, partial [Candidatus Obscuribacterales bacterium]|nr:PLP-dependent transferase [Candidatus Obscuribacterales bacterium]